MDYTQGGEKLKQDRAKKQMLWFGIISLCMTFAGLTSAYIVSMERRDWLHNYELPQAFVISTVVIVMSSVTVILAKNAIISGKRTIGTILLSITLLLGIAFIILQYDGIFNELTSQGYYVTGPSSSITITFLFLIAFLHVAHVIAGIIVLITMFVNHLRGKYTKDEYLGLSIGATFWHFVDILWIFLFVLIYITK